jgi:hypothetical protein
VYSVIEQRLKCNNSEMFNSVFTHYGSSIEECAFLVENIFREHSRYTSLVQEQFAGKLPETPVPHRNAVIEKFREMGSVVEVEQSGRPSKLNDEQLFGHF